MPTSKAASSTLAFLTLIPVSVPRISAADASPTDSTRNGVPNPEAWATSASTTRDADTTVRWIPIRLMTSDQVWLRVANRLQCSVASSCARTPAGTAAAALDEGEVAAEPGATAGGLGSGPPHHKIAPTRGKAVLSVPRGAPPPNRPPQP